jgi:hypothetical protein
MGELCTVYARTPFLCQKINYWIITHLAHFEQRQRPTSSSNQSLLRISRPLPSKIFTQCHEKRTSHNKRLRLSIVHLQPPLAYSTTADHQAGSGTLRPPYEPFGICTSRFCQALPRNRVDATSGEASVQPLNTILGRKCTTGVSLGFGSAAWLSCSRLGCTNFTTLLLLSRLRRYGRGCHAHF